MKSVFGSHPVRHRFAAALALGLVLIFVADKLGQWRVDATETQTLAHAQQLLYSNRTDEVRNVLTWLLWYHPDHPEAQFLYGASLHVDGRHSEAISLLERVAADSDSFRLASLTLARCLLTESRQTDAELVLRKHLSAVPDSDPAREELLKLYTSQLRKRDAVKLLEDRWTVFPGDLSILRGLLLLETETISADSRIFALDESNRQQPNQPSVLLALAQASVELGLEDDARRYFRKAMELRPGHVATCIQAAEFYLSINAIVQAETLLTHVDSPSATDNDRFWNARARLLDQQRSYQEALKCIDRSIELRAYEVNYWNRKSAIHRRLKQAAEAELASRTAVRIARARNDLFILTNEADLDTPTKAVCEEIAAHYDAMNRPDRAALWRQLIPYAK